jgi:hypothetical protein
MQPAILQRTERIDNDASDTAKSFHAERCASQHDVSDTAIRTFLVP